MTDEAQSVDQPQMAEQTELAPNNGEVVTCAILDDDGVYQGMVTVAQKDLTEKHLHMITECDLPPGKYYWNYEKECFFPIRPPESEHKSTIPNTLRAIHSGFKALSENAKFKDVFPKETLAWIEQFPNSFDNRDQ